MESNRRIAEMARALPDEALVKFASVPTPVLAGLIRKLPNDDLASFVGFGKSEPPPAPVVRTPRTPPTEETVARVFGRICETGGDGKSDLAKALELDTALVDAALKTLVETGKIERTGAGRATLYKATGAAA